MTGADSTPARAVEGLRRLAPGNAGFARLLEELAERQPVSLAWHARAARAAAGLPTQLPYESPLLPVYFDRAAGARVTDVDGNEYVDCHLGYTADILGPSAGAPAEALARALEAGVGPGTGVPAQVQLCELVCATTGAERAALFHTGGEALTAAVRLARAATGRPLVAKFEGCYHGATELGLYGTTRLLGGTGPEDPPDTTRPVAGTAGLDAGAAEGLVVLPYGEQSALDRVEALGPRLAAVVVDPAPPFAASRFDELGGFLRGLRDVTAAAGTPLVLDEVVSGFRLARGGAQEAFGLRADLACYAKVLSGAGLPLAALAGDARLVDLARTAGVLADRPGRLAWVTSTFAANPLCVAAALERLTYLTAHHETLMARVDSGHKRLAAKLAGVRELLGVPVAVHGHPRLQPMLGLFDPESVRSGDGWHRDALRGVPADRYRVILASTLYLRRYGVYAKSAPTLAISAAHDDADVDAIAWAVEQGVGRMLRDGVLTASASAA